MDIKTIFDHFFPPYCTERFSKSMRTRVINDDLGLYDRTEEYLDRDEIMPITIDNGLVNVLTSSTVDKQVSIFNNNEPLVLSTARRCPFLFCVDIKVSPLLDFTDKISLQSSEYKTELNNLLRDENTSRVFGGAMLEAMLEQLKNINPVYAETEWVQRLPHIAQDYMKLIFTPIMRRYYLDITTCTRPILTPLRVLFSGIRYEGIAVVPPANMQDKLCEHKWKCANNLVIGYVYGRGSTIEIPNTTGVHNELEIDYNSTINFNVALGNKRKMNPVLRQKSPLGTNMPDKDPPVTVYFCVAPTDEVFAHPESGVMDSGDPILLGNTLKENTKDLIPEFVSTPNKVMKHREIRGQSGLVFNSKDGKMTFGNIYTMFAMTPQQEKLFMGEHFLGPDTDYSETSLTNDQSCTWLVYFAPSEMSKLDVLEDLAQTCIKYTRCGSITNKRSLRSVGAIKVGTVVSSKGHNIYWDTITNRRKLKLCNFSSNGKTIDKMEFLDFFYSPMNKDIDTGIVSLMKLSKMETSNDTGFKDDVVRRTILSDISDENFEFLPDYCDPLQTKEDKTREIMAQYTLNTLRTALHYDKVLGTLKENITNKDIVEAAGRIGSLGMAIDLQGKDLSAIPKAFGGYLSSGYASTSARKRAADNGSRWLHGDPLYKCRRINLSGEFEDIPDDELELTIDEQREAELAELIEQTGVATSMGSFSRDCRCISDKKLE